MRTEKRSRRPDAVNIWGSHPLPSGNCRQFPPSNIERSYCVIVRVCLQVCKKKEKAANQRVASCPIKPGSLCFNVLSICVPTTRAKLPALLRATPLGAFNVADVPIPSEYGRDTPRRPTSDATFALVNKIATIGLGEGSCDGDCVGLALQVFDCEMDSDCDGDEVADADKGTRDIARIMQCP
jgi:hypothetical protein